MTEIRPARTSTLDADDLARGVAHLDDATILRTLHERYDGRVIYSSVNRMYAPAAPVRTACLHDRGLRLMVALPSLSALTARPASVQADRDQPVSDPEHK
jgi:hypothetical protein